MLTDLRDPVRLSSRHGRLEQWYSKATVRNAPRRLLHDEDGKGKLFFPPELVPFLQHLLVVERGPDAARHLLIQSLYVYEHFTARLERQVINRTVLSIADGICGISVTDTMRLRADQIYTDEAWHAQFSNDLMSQVIDATGVLPLIPKEPRFLRLLSERLQTITPENRALAGLFFTITSETLISAILLDIPRDRRIVTAVREQVADHARDEGMHHEYFAEFLRIVWPQLSRRERGFIGPQIADFVLWFLQPDDKAIFQLLANIGVQKEECSQVIRDCYPISDVTNRVRQAAKHSIRLFESVGILDDRATYETFLERGLIEQT